MNRIKSIAYLKTLVCLLILVRCSGCSSHLAKIYSRLNQDSKRDLDKADHSIEKYNYPLDKLMNRLGYNSSKDATPSNIIDYNIDRHNRNYLGRRESSTANPLVEPPNSLVTHTGSALWRRRSVSGQRPRVAREEFSKEQKRKKFAGEERERAYERKSLYEDSEDNEDEEEEEPEEEEDMREYQDLDPISYDADHRNVRHGASYTRFEQSESNQHQRTNQQVSPTTKKKWELLGSAKKVDELFQASRKNGGVRRISDDWSDPHPKKQAENHIVKILKEGKCKWPQQRLIKVSESYPSMTKTYFPSCTILYRCGDDTGCCPLSSQKCTARNSTTVELYFTTSRVDARNGNKTVINDIEKLTFTNDTECDCVEIMPRDSELERLTDNKPKTGCACPTEFSVRYMANGSCTCDCFDKQNDCLRYKRGLKYFDHQDRLCIAEGRCEKPLCRFGVYEHKYGRCPKRHEKFQKFSKYSY